MAKLCNRTVEQLLTIPHLSRSLDKGCSPINWRYPLSSNILIRPLSAGGRRCECRQCGQWTVAGIIAGRMYTTLQQHRATEPELEPGLQTGGQCVHCSMQTSGSSGNNPPSCSRSLQCLGPCCSAGAADQWRRDTGLLLLPVGWRDTGVTLGTRAANGPSRSWVPNLTSTST